MATTFVDTSLDGNDGSNSTRRILVLLAHPSLDRSEMNQPMADAVLDLEDVVLVDLYAEHPDFQIDIDHEQARLLTLDVMVFPHPLYWYSTPAILREWQDWCWNMDSRTVRRAWRYTVRSSSMPSPPAIRRPPPKGYAEKISD